MGCALGFGQRGLLGLIKGLMRILPLFSIIAVLSLTACASNGFGDEFVQMDVNRDKVLTREELSARYNPRVFDDMDRNGSNTITHAEFNRYDPLRRYSDPTEATGWFYNK